MPTMTVILCYKCGIEFHVATNWNANRIEDKNSFFCPNGHSQSYVGKTDREKLAEKEAELAKVRSALYAERDDKEKAQAKLSRISKRIHAGVCPKCNRTFENVALHMKSKHTGTKK